MATGWMVVNVMDVGQGQGTFVEVYNTAATPVLTNTLLFDLGSAKSSVAAGGPSIEYIAKQVASMAVPKIDYMSLSHKDKDHINLIVKLVDAINLKIKPPKKKLTIGHVRYGGMKEWYPDNLVIKLQSICTDVKPLSLLQNCYEKGPPAKWTPIWLENDVHVYVILANALTANVDAMDMSDLDSRKPDSELANSVSIISSIFWNSNQFFINGDATFVTFQESNKIYKLVPNFNAPKMVTLPHHGSRKTTFGLSSSTEDAGEESTEVVETFAKKISARTVTASAEKYGDYHHPSYDVMLTFNKFADQETVWYYDPNLANKNRHYAFAYLDTPLVNDKKTVVSGAYGSFETTMNVYSTFYRFPEYTGDFLAPPRKPKDPVGPGTTFPKPAPIFPLGVQWVYTVNSAGQVKLTPKTNRSATLFNVEEAMKDLGLTRKWVKALPAGSGIPVKAAIPAKNPAVLRGLKSFR